MSLSSAADTQPTWSLRYVYWESNGDWLGCLESSPDYWTQGESLDDLVDHHCSLLEDLESGDVTGVRRVGLLDVPAATSRSESI